MPGRSLKGHVAHISTGFLRLLNMIIIAGGAASIIIVFIISPSPSFPAGWGLIAVGCFVIISGAFGAISSGQGGCMGCHVSNLVISSAGLCAAFLVIFLKLNTMLREIDYHVRRSMARKLLRIEAAIYFILFCTQLVILMLACLIHRCGFVDYYEDLVVLTSEPSNSKELGSIQIEETVQREERRDTTNNQKLAEKIRKKYGIGSMETESDHFDTESQTSSRR